MERKCLRPCNYRLTVNTVLLILLSVQKDSLQLKRGICTTSINTWMLLKCSPIFLKCLLQPIRLLSVDFVHFDHHSKEKSLTKEGNLSRAAAAKQT